MGPHAMQKRTLKSTRQKRGIRSQANPQCTCFTICRATSPGTFAVHHGARGRYLYFQCLQILLRLQVSALAELWSLPTGFEVRGSRHFGVSANPRYTTGDMSRRMGFESLSPPQPHTWRRRWNVYSRRRQRFRQRYTRHK